MNDSEWLTTGVDAVDSVLGGGVPPGTVLTVSGAAASQSEVLLRAFAAVHETVYISTDRCEASVRRSLSESVHDDSECEGMVTVVRVGVDAPVARVEDIMEGDVVEGGARVVVIDSIGLFEEAVSVSEYREFLHSVREAVASVGGVVVLFASSETSGNANRAVTVGVSDTVVTIDRVVDGKSVSVFFDVPKHRYGEPLSERVTVTIGETVTVDNSRGY